MTSFISMLKTIIPLKKLILKWLNVGDGKVNRFDIDNNKEIAKKSRKSKS